MLYFVKAEGVGHIKIGFVEGVDATKRLCELQVGSPVRLTLLGTQPGDRAAEMDLHRRFASACVHGEWFQPVEELLDLIGNVEVPQDVVDALNEVVSSTDALADGLGDIDANPPV